MGLSLLSMILDMHPIIKRLTMIFTRRYIKKQEDLKPSNRRKNRVNTMYCSILKINDTISK